MAGASGPFFKVVSRLLPGGFAPPNAASKLFAGPEGAAGLAGLSAAGTIGGVGEGVGEGHQGGAEQAKAWI